jgi:hypothetical protein
MALEGTLRDFSLADIFQLIGLQRKTGVLSLRSPDDVVTISFVDGKVVAADSLTDRLEDRLGQILIKTGAISAEELTASLKEQMETLERLGRVLLRRKAIDRESLREALQRQTLQIIFRVFRWQDGDYNFSQEVSVDYDPDLVVPITAESILMEGARMLDEWPIIERRISHRGMLFVPTPAVSNLEVVEGEDELLELDLDATPPEPQPPGGRVRIGTTEHTVLQLVDGFSTVEEILKKSSLGEFETCKALYTLLMRGLIREANRFELARAMRRDAVPASASPSLHGFPWLLLLLLPLLVSSLLVARHNPLNPIAGPCPKLTPRVLASVSRARMEGLWGALHAHASLAGSLPGTLSELVSTYHLNPGVAKDPWGRPYQYILREDSVILAGSGATGSPEPELILSHHSLGARERTPVGAGVSLLGP